MVKYNQNINNMKKLILLILIIGAGVGFWFWKSNDNEIVVKTYNNKPSQTTQTRDTELNRKFGVSNSWEFIEENKEENYTSGYFMTSADANIINSKKIDKDSSLEPVLLDSKINFIAFGATTGAFIGNLSKETELRYYLSEPITDSSGHQTNIVINDLSTVVKSGTKLTLYKEEVQFAKPLTKIGVVWIKGDTLFQLEAYVPNKLVSSESILETMAETYISHQ